MSSFHDQKRFPPNSLQATVQTLTNLFHDVSNNAWTKTLRRRRLRQLINLTNVLALVWICVIYWGERSTFSRKISKCDWRFWEDWPEGAQPHRLMFVADPQLVDPHTYPGRPWPLSTLTVKYTDQYMRRVFSQSIHELNPQTTLFLGDLFDGGREWSTANSESPEKRWHKYRGDFWLREYVRFANNFWKPWWEWQRSTGEGFHKLLASLPGNHDLGFAAGVQEPVRRRFNAYFGEGNRIDIIGNHSIVSLDSVSLSAMDTDAPQDIWKPAAEFLTDNTRARRRATARAMNFQEGKKPTPKMKYKHTVFDSEALSNSPLPPPNDNVGDLPVILLTHVPLWRDPDTPCGPLREKWPPSKGVDIKDPTAKDPRNAISVSFGYQYQNVLSQKVTHEVLTGLGNVDYVFSGDDHDYCELIHRGGVYGDGEVREITVKSLSWAMGVRKPGFVLASLWNPVDDQGSSLKRSQKTMQTHLCLMPDQLGTFIRYAVLFIVTLVSLALRAIMISQKASMSPSSTTAVPLLPLSQSDTKADKHEERDVHKEPSSNSTTVYSNASHLSTRGPGVRTRGTSPANGYGIPASIAGEPNGGRQPPLVSHAGYHGPPYDMVDHGYGKTKKNMEPLSGTQLALNEMLRSTLKVAGVAGLWYWWLLRGL